MYIFAFVTKKMVRRQPLSETRGRQHTWLRLQGRCLSCPSHLSNPSSGRHTQFPLVTSDYHIRSLLISAAALLGDDVWLPQPIAACRVTTLRSGASVAVRPPPGLILPETMAPVWCFWLCSLLAAVALCNGGEDLSLRRERGLTN